MINQQKAIELCIELYEHLSPKGFFPALTGGQLYKDGNRKDIDIVIYRHRQMEHGFEIKDIEPFLIETGLYEFKHFGFVTKAKWKGLSVDLFNPETNDLNSNY